MRIKHADYRWLLWGVSRTPHGDLPPDVLARIAADRQRAAALRVVTRTLPIAWQEDHSVHVRFIGHCGRIRDAWRRWAELEFNDRPVFLETFGGNGGGPGFGFTDVRIYLDEGIVGRAWQVGCSLGFGGGGGPAVAMLRDDLALRVDREQLNLELVRLTEPGIRKRGGSRDRTPRDRISAQD